MVAAAADAVVAAAALRRAAASVIALEATAFGDCGGSNWTARCPLGRRSAGSMHCMRWLKTVSLW